MFRLPLWSIQLVGALLVLNPPISALIGFDRYTDRAMALVAVVIYLVSALLSVFYYRARKMPDLLAWLNVAVVVIVPQFIHQSIDAMSVGSQSSWYVSGIGALLAVTAIRGHQVVSWIGTSILALEVLVWGGFGALFNTGLAGSVALVVTANALSYALARIEIETQDLINKTIEIEASSAIDLATRTERTRRLSDTLRVSHVLLQRISKGEIDEETRQEAQLLEAELRDGIRGRDFIDSKLKESIKAARRRGIEVTVLDEGGLTLLDDSVKSEIRQKFALELDQISSGRVTIRAPRGGSTKATFVASRPGTATPDVFLRL